MRLCVCVHVYIYLFLAFLSLSLFLLQTGSRCAQSAEDYRHRRKK